MKKFAWVILAIIAISLLMSLGVALADSPPMPPPGPGAGAGKYVATPIGGGIVVLLSMIGYGIYKARRSE